MELGLSLGDASNQQFGFMGGRKKSNNNNNQNKNQNQNFSMNLSIGSGYYDEITENPSPIQLNLLSSDSGGRRGFDVNRTPAPSTFEEDDGEDNEVGMAMSSSPSGTSSFQMDLCIGNGHKTGDNINNYHNNVGSGCYVLEKENNGDEDENGGGSRKKLRLSKDQSAFLEESFKEHNTLNPNQKIALAKQLNLRPRQIEVWFQNRRARTKLKQTEVDCEYLKRCCETLTEENRRLHKELQELRTLKSSNSNPFNMQLPATTLTICPSCDRTISNKAAASATVTANANTGGGGGGAGLTDASSAGSKQSNTTSPFSLSSSRPRFYPFSNQSKA